MPAGDARGIVYNHHYDLTENINIKYSKIPHEVVTSSHSPNPTYLSQTSAFVCTIYWLSSPQCMVHSTPGMFME